MATEVSGEVLRLLSILSGRPNGATQHELTVLEGINASLIYKAIVLALVRAHPQSGQGTVVYHYHLMDAGRKLLNAGCARR